MPEASVAKSGDAARKSVYLPDGRARIGMNAHVSLCAFEGACATTFAESAVRNSGLIPAIVLILKFLQADQIVGQHGAISICKAVVV